MAIFKIKEGEKPVEIEPVIGREKPLEEFLEENPIVIQKDMFIIGRQVATADGKYIDLLGIDKSCSVIIIELKKDDKNQREVIAQILQYAEWIHNDVDSDELNQITKKYFKKYKPNEEFTTLRKKFESTFGFEPESLNESQKLYIIAPKIDEQTIKVAEYLELQSLDINCLKVERHVDGTEMTVNVTFVVGGQRTKTRSDKPHQPVHPNYDWDYYTMYGHWEEKTVEELQRICDYISKYSEERGWKLQLEFNQNSVIFRRSPRELKEKFGDRRVIDLKSLYGNPDDKVRISFNWLKDRDKKPDGKFDFKYGETRWYFDIERDGKLDLSSHSDFEKVLVQAYNATTER